MIPLQKIAKSLHRGLIVSCHAEHDPPFNKPEYVAGFGMEAERGGAAGLRVSGISYIEAMRSRTRLPIVGFIAGEYDDGSLLITPDFDDVERLIAAKADIIAIDCTTRRRPNGFDGLEFFKQVRQRHKHLLWADVSVFREGVKAAEYGADFIATTLSGYTPSTLMKDLRKPDFSLIRELSISLTVPIVAEGRIWSPQDAALAIDEGAYSVVVGTAITRPRTLTQMFAAAIRGREGEEAS
jgi:N-acylglucosamine-6-phosphate 2-epimerase